MNISLVAGLGIIFIVVGVLISMLFYKVTFGSVLLIILGLGLVMWSILDYLKLEGIYKREVDIIRKVFFALFIAWLFSFLVIEGFILTAVNPDGEARVDYVIVLGAGLRGETPSLTLHTRLMKGLEYLNEHPELKVVVSGGQGPGESITEAEAMKRFYMNKGIKESRIIKEGKSTSTMENLSFSKEILDKEEKVSKNRVMIVTSDFHMFRSKYLAKKLDFIPYGMPAKTPFYLWMDYSVREYFAVIKSLVFD